MEMKFLRIAKAGTVSDRVHAADYQQPGGVTTSRGLPLSRTKILAVSPAIKWTPHFVLMTRVVNAIVSFRIPFSVSRQECFHRTEGEGKAPARASTPTLFS